MFKDIYRGFFVCLNFEVTLTLKITSLNINRLIATLITKFASFITVSMSYYSCHYLLQIVA